MVQVGDSAPEFSVPMAGGETYNDLDSFTLSEALTEGPVVLAFVPAAFTSACTEELCSFRDSMARFRDLDARVYGLSVDLPFAQNIWIREQELTFPMLSDWDHEVIRAYDVVYPDMYGSIESAQRSVFVIDSDGMVTYRWVREGGNPEFGSFVNDVRERVDAVRR
jgi:peroxiredoxin